MGGDPPWVMGAFFALVIATFVMAGMTMVFAFLGVVWSPFAALVCYIIAHFKGYPKLRFTIAGAVYSVLFILPWFYLVTWMFGRRLPRILAGLCYLFVYVAWLAVLLFLELEAANTEITSSSLWDADLWSRIAINLLALISASTLIYSLWRIKRQRAADALDVGVPRPDDLPNRAYIMPLVWLLFWLITFHAVRPD